jgi:serine/threonine-protein kinase RsbW
MQDGELDLTARSLELPASMASWDDLFCFVQAEVTRCLGGHPKEYPLVLACEELLSNMIRYSSGSTDDGSPVTIRICSHVQRNEGELLYRLQFSDNGPPFDPQFEMLDTSVADVPIQRRQIGGLGLFLIKTSVDKVDYSYVDRRNLYTIDTRLDRCSCVVDR